MSSVNGRLRDEEGVQATESWRPADDAGRTRPTPSYLVPAIAWVLLLIVITARISVVAGERRPDNTGTIQFPPDIRRGKGLLRGWEKNIMTDQCIRDSSTNIDEHADRAQRAHARASNAAAIECPRHSYLLASSTSFRYRSWPPSTLSWNSSSWRMKTC